MSLAALGPSAVASVLPYLGLGVGLVALITGLVVSAYLSTNPVTRYLRKLHRERVFWRDNTRYMFEPTREQKRIRAEARARAIAREDAEDEARVQKILAAVEASDAKTAALVELIRAQLRDDGRRAYKQSLWVGGLFFLAGCGVTVAVTLFVHPL